MDNELETAINKWSSNALLSAWVILQMPDFDGDGDIVIGEADIEQLAKCIKTADEQMAALLAACEAALPVIVALKSSKVSLYDFGTEHLLGIENQLRAAIARARGE